MSNLIKAIALLSDTFDKYAKEEGDSKTLTKKELSKMIRTELPVTDASNQAEMDKFFKMLDGDGDGVVDFTEYITFVATVAAILKEDKC